MKQTNQFHFDFQRKRAKRARDRGQGLIEYLIIVALMAVATIGIVRVLSQTVSAKFAASTMALQGRTPSHIQVESVEERHFKKKDLSNFFNGAGSKGGNGNGNKNGSGGNTSGSISDSGSSDKGDSTNE